MRLSRRSLFVLAVAGAVMPMPSAAEQMVTTCRRLVDVISAQAKAIADLKAMISELAARLREPTERDASQPDPPDPAKV